MTQRFSTPGSSASCWVLLNRWTSSTNSTVSVPLFASARRAPAMTSRTSLTPAETAEISTNRRLVCRLISEAIVVLPVPGGPHSSSVSGWSPSMTCRSGEPGRQQVLLADELVERARPHAHGERRRRVIAAGEAAAAGCGHRRVRQVEEPVGSHADRA